MNVKRKHLWVLDILFRIKPCVYRATVDRDLARRRLDGIVNMLRTGSVRWRNGYARIAETHRIIEKPEGVSILTEGGNPVIEFVMETVNVDENDLI